MKRPPPPEWLPKVERGSALPSIPAKRYDRFTLLALVQQQAADGEQHCAAGAQGQRGQAARQYERCEHEHATGEHCHHERQVVVAVGQHAEQRRADDEKHRSTRRECECAATGAAHPVPSVGVISIVECVGHRKSASLRRAAARPFTDWLAARVANA